MDYVYKTENGIIKAARSSMKTVQKKLEKS
jgi:hypothetical protein